MWIADKHGEVHKVRAVKRIPFEDRWGEDNAVSVKHTPWNRYKVDPHADGEIPDEKAVEMKRCERMEMDKDEKDEKLIQKKYVAPRTFRITKADAEKHGYTRGCAGCSSWFRGLARQEHHKDCRERFEEAMKSEAKVVRAKVQKEEFVRRVAKRRNQSEEDDAKRRKNVEEGAKEKEMPATGKTLDVAAENKMEEEEDEDMKDVKRRSWPGRFLRKMVMKEGLPRR